MTYEIRSRVDGSNAHVTSVYPGEKPSPFCYSESAKRIGKNVVATVEGDYMELADWIEAHPGVVCDVCQSMAFEFAKDRQEQLAQTIAEGATAGRTIRYVFEDVVESVSPAAVLFSMKDAKERMEHALEGTGIRLARVEYADEVPS